MRNVEERQAILNLYDNESQAREAIKTPSQINHTAPSQIEEEEKQPMSATKDSPPTKVRNDETANEFIEPPPIPGFNEGIQQQVGPATHKLDDEPDDFL